METKDIIKIFNETIQKNNSSNQIHFVVVKKITPSIFKAYKQYEYTLWCICNNKKFKVKTMQQTARVITDKEKESITKRMEELLLSNLYLLLLEEVTLNSLLNGSYKEPLD